MYAVVRTGAKQLRLAPGDSVWVERLPGEVGESVELTDVLLVGGDQETHIGTPRVDGAKVVGIITAHGRGPKLTIFKLKRRKNQRRKQGHRQDYTQIRVESIEA